MAGNCTRAGDAGAVRLADDLVAALYEAGIATAFMVAGGGSMHLNDALVAHGGIEVICTLHEQGAAIAAEAYARYAGTPALCLVTTGPGATNAVTPVASAFVDSVPMVVVSGQVKRSDLASSSGLRQRGVQEIDICSIVGPVTKWARTLLDPAEGRAAISEALELATSGRPGPVWLDVPLDVQAAPVRPGEVRPRATSRDNDEGVDPAPVAARVAELLASSRRPLVLIGAGVATAGAGDKVRDLLSRVPIPVASTWPAKGIVGHDDPRHVGCPGPFAPRGANFALQAADLLICLGARLDLATTGYDPKDFGRNATKVVVDIDPAELDKLEGAIEIGHLGDVGAFCAALSARADLSWTDVEGWLERCQDWRRRYPLVTDAHRARSSSVSTYHFAEVLSDQIAHDDVLAFGCSGLAIEIFLAALRLRQGQRAVFGSAFGPMGWGPPTAIGACLASGRRRTICVDGDGGLQLNAQELETIRRLRLPVKLFVLSNDGYASIRASQQRWFGRLSGADQTSGVSIPPLRGIAAAYGIAYAALEGEAELAPQLAAVLGRPGPVLCEVPTPRDEARIPAQTSEARPDGTIVSLPLEDLAPRLSRAELAEHVLGPNGRFGS